MSSFTETATALKQILQLGREPVGVKFLEKDELAGLKENYDQKTKTRYCQGLMRASEGEKILITANNISCPASAAAFGLKPLPEMLLTGEMLYNMGLFASREAGKNAMDGMTRLEPGEYEAVLLSPLSEIELQPDVVVIESKPEHLMWVALASIYETGERLQFNSAIFQATCVDSTVIPFKTGNVNASLGCYGCREATNIEDTECLIGLPFDKLAETVGSLAKIAAKPMLKARGKEVFRAFNPA